jgi:virginiamycin B lyase
MGPSPSAQRSITDLPILAKLSIPGSPDWVGIDSNAVWISNAAKNSVSRIDPATNSIATTVAVGRQPCSGLAVGFGGLWVPSCGDRRVDRVDTTTNIVTAHIPTRVGDSEGAIAVGMGSVWLMTDRQGTLARIDPTTNQIAARIRTVPDSFAVATGAGAVWVTSTGGNVLSRVDPQRNRVTARIPVGRSPRFLCVFEDHVWVLNQGDGTVSRVDATANRVVATIPVGVPGPGGDIAAGEGSVWVTAINVPLTRVDTKKNKVAVQFVGKGGDAMRVGLGSLWLCSFFLQEVWRVNPDVG